MADNAPSHDQPAALLDAPAAALTGATEAAPGPVAALKAEDAREASTGSGSGASTPFDLSPEQQEKSLKVTLADLSAKATALYAQKNYDEAVELYSAAAVMQAEMYGDMSPDNAEILFLYGRALFRVGQGKSDVLGGRAPDATKPKKKPKAKVAPAPATGAGETNGSAEKTDPTVKDATDAEPSAAEKKKEDLEAPKKPLFHFEGDENFYESEEDEVRALSTGRQRISWLIASTGRRGRRVRCR